MENTTFTASLILSTNELLGNNLDKNEVGRMIKGLLPKVLQSFKLEHQQNLTFPVHNTHNRYFGFGDDLETRSVQTPPKLVIKLIKLAKSTNLDIQGIMGDLLKYANTARNNATSTTFHELLFPVATTICELIAQTKRAPTADEKDFITKLLKSYVNDYVKKARAPPADWKSRTTIRCTCSDCRELRRFIDDLGATTRDFAMPEKRRKHLEQQLDRSYFNAVTIKRGTPHKLRVKKTTAMLISYYNAWLIRVATARSVLNELSEKGPLKEIIGDDTYRAIFEHTNLQVSEANPLGNATNPNARPTVQSTVPQKRSWLG